MSAYLQQNWDKILTAIIAIYGAGLSTYMLWREKRKDRREEEKIKRDERIELTRLLSETSEMTMKVALLDEWIWEKRIFTRKQRILDSLANICDFWKENAESFRGYLGTDSQTYKALYGLFLVAQQNLDNQPPPNGEGQWKGITENLFGLTVRQIFSQAEADLKKIRI